MKQTTEKRHRTVAFRVWTGHKPGYPTGVSLPTHHVLEFHLCNWLFMLHLSLAKVGNFFPSTMERHSHFKSEVDERERSGVPLGGNRFCIPGLKGLQQWLVTSTGRDMSWDGFPLVFLADTQAYWLYSAGVCIVWVKWFGKVTVLPAWNCKGCNLLEVLKLFWFKLCLDHLRNMLSVTAAILLTLS